MSGADVVRDAPVAAQAARERARRRPEFLTGRLIVGLLLVLGPLVGGLIGSLVVDPAGLRIAAALPGIAPSAEHPLGSDTAGRDVFALIVTGTPPTYLIGAVAGFLSVLIGTIVGLVSGYSRGVIDTIVRAGIDVTLGIPSLAVVIVIAAVLGSISPLQLGLVIAALGWAYPARQIRSQVLSLREQQFVFISRLSNEGPLRIMFAEILPNILPFVMAAFVASVSFSILVAVGLQLLGLGTAESTLGLVLQLAITGGALSRGMWWWWAPPALILSAMFLGLFLVSTAVDRFANPRLREVPDRG
jgi:peptide/nickel transport system permease protein